MMLNSRFRFLDHGECPSVVKHTICWTHPGSYLSEIGIQAGSYRLHIVSGDRVNGFQSINILPSTDIMGLNFTSAQLQVWHHSSHEIKVVAGNFEMIVQNSDHFVNLISVKVLDWSSLSSSGLLGSTWRVDWKLKDVDDYAEVSTDLFGNNFAFDRS